METQTDALIDQLKWIGSQKFTRSMITPEIAAFVVKEYLLPMFESDGKRILSKKKDQGRSESRAKKQDDEMPLTEEQLLEKDYTKIKINANDMAKTSDGPLPSNKTVYQELKLSQILLADIDQYKQIIWKKNEEGEKQSDLVIKLQKQGLEAQRIIQKMKLIQKQNKHEIKSLST